MSKYRFRELFGECDPDLLKKFVKFHRENPVVYQLFVRFSNDAKRAGRPRFSAWAVANRIRWYTSIETRGTEYKLSNDFIALYARLVVYRFPEFDGFFLLKKMKSSRKSIVRLVS